MKKESKEVALQKQMKAVYDYNIDTLTAIFSEAPVSERDEDKEGMRRSRDRVDY